MSHYHHANSKVVINTCDISQVWSPFLFGLDIAANELEPARNSAGRIDALVSRATVCLSQLNFWLCI